ncbi:hypothetical protein MPSEU_000050500 [Mayamaea pseudoterrestris]|nr:hypothetical protein MPSEU_000050500 [Mayamaea pseudoterrestris]
MSYTENRDEPSPFISSCFSTETYFETADSLFALFQKYITDMRLDDAYSTGKLYCKVCDECGHYCIIQEYDKYRFKHNAQVVVVTEQLKIIREEMDKEELKKQQAQKQESKQEPASQSLDSTISIAELAEAFEADELFKALAVLQIRAKQPDLALKTMMKHDAAWKAAWVLDATEKVADKELVYDAISHCLGKDPALIPRILKATESRVDILPLRILDCLLEAETDGLHLGLSYLKSIQAHVDLPEVNEALITYYLSVEDYIALHKSVLRVKKFNAMALAEKLETGKTALGTCIAATLYCRINHYQHAIDILTSQELWKECILVAKTSANRAIVAELLRFFCRSGMKVEAAACLDTCFGLIHLDIAYDVAYEYKLGDYAHPFIKQKFCQLSQLLHPERRLDDVPKKSDQVSVCENAGTFPVALFPETDESISVPYAPYYNGMNLVRDFWLSEHVEPETLAAVETFRVRNQATNKQREQAWQYARLVELNNPNSWERVWNMVNDEEVASDKTVMREKILEFKKNPSRAGLPKGTLDVLRFFLPGRVEACSANNNERSKRKSKVSSVNNVGESPVVQSASDATARIGKSPVGSASGATAHDGCCDDKASTVNVGDTAGDEVASSDSDQNLILASSAGSSGSVGGELHSDSNHSSSRFSVHEFDTVASDVRSVVSGDSDILAAEADGCTNDEHANDGDSFVLCGE